MFFEVLNRLFGRTDQSIDAVNAYVKGNASVDETQLVEKMMREDSSLAKDLSTQTALLSVLGRIDQVEAPRSFAISPEMVAAAERSESRLSRFAELFAPQRKLALAPAVITGIAALSVALLTLGDITGVVDQSRSNQSTSISTSAVSESAVEVEATERLLPKSEKPAASSAETEQSDSDGSMAIEASPDLAYSEGVLPGMAITNDGISLPLRQLQFALAALALAVVGVWAGLRRARGE